MLKTKKIAACISGCPHIVLVYLQSVTRDDTAMEKTKKNIWIFALLLIFISCKKDKKEETDTTPPPPATCDVTVEVKTYDSLGNPESNFSGVTVSLYQTNYSAVTNSAGTVSFSGVQQKSYLPVLSKTGYEGAQISIDLTNKTSYTAPNLPVAKKSTFAIQNFTTQLVHKDSITMSFNLSQAVPAGQQIKVAVLTYSNAGINSVNYSSADIVTFTTSVVNKYNISQLPNFKTSVNSLLTNSSFYISAIPLSYGLYPSNILPRPLLLGTNLYYPQAAVYTKNW